MTCPPPAAVAGETCACCFSALKGPTKSLCLCNIPLLLEYNSAQVPEGGIALIGNCAAPVKLYGKDPAGFEFHQAALRLAGVTDPDDGDDAESNNPSEKSDGAGYYGDASEASWEKSKSNFKKKKKDKDGGEEEKKEQDHYAVLGLAHLRFMATEDQIKKAYRDSALKYHPDKVAGSALADLSTEDAAEKKEEIEAKFKCVQTAYETLSDPTKRRVYDSTDEFDDEIPSAADAAALSPDNYSKVFGPVFMRNGKWSIVQPVPAFGDDSTSIADVDKFYDFWFGFKSWREFPNEDDYDLDTAENREHKRWMERQNAKLREKAKKEESARIRTLVETAFRRDPRLVRQKEEEKREKQRKKEEKREAKLLREEEERKRREEEETRREEEEKRRAEGAALAKKQREKDKKLLRKERARLRAAVGNCVESAVAAAASARASKSRKNMANGGDDASPGKSQRRLTEDELEEILQSLELDQLRSACEALENYNSIGCTNDTENSVGIQNGDASWGEPEGERKVETLLMWLSVARQNKEKERIEAATTAAAEKVKEDEERTRTREREAKAPVSLPWSTEELNILKKALVKFPRGTSNRWEAVATYMKHVRTVDEIVKAVKEDLTNKPQGNNAFNTFLQKRKQPKDIVSPLSTRTPEETVAGSKPSETSEKSNREPTETSASASEGSNSASVPSAPLSSSSPSSSPSPSPSPSSASNHNTTETNGVVLPTQKTTKKSPQKAGTQTGSQTETTSQDTSTIAPTTAVSAAASPSVNWTASAQSVADGSQNGEEGSVSKSAVTDAWSSVQELALIKAMKAFPKDAENRWDRIAAAVPGKTKGQCVKKFASLKEGFRSKKGSTANSSSE